MALHKAVLTRTEKEPYLVRFWGNTLQETPAKPSLKQLAKYLGIDYLEQSSSSQLTFEKNLKA